MVIRREFVQQIKVAHQVNLHNACNEVEQSPESEGLNKCRQGLSDKLLQKQQGGNPENIDAGCPQNRCRAQADKEFLHPWIKCNEISGGKAQNRNPDKSQNAFFADEEQRKGQQAPDEEILVRLVLKVINLQQQPDCRHDERSVKYNQRFGQEEFVLPAGEIYAACRQHKQQGCDTEFNGGRNLLPIGRNDGNQSEADAEKCNIKTEIACQSTHFGIGVFHQNCSLLKSNPAV